MELLKIDLNTFNIVTDQYDIYISKEINPNTSSSLTGIIYIYFVDVFKNIKKTVHIESNSFDEISLLNDYLINNYQINKTLINKINKGVK